MANPNWVKGMPSPNQTGRKKMTPEQQLARDIRNRSQPAIMTFLVRTALDENVDMKDRIACAKIVADAPPQEIEISSGESPQWVEDITKEEALEIIELSRKANVG